MKNKILILGITSFAGYTFAKYMLKKKFFVIGTFNSNKSILDDIENFKNLKLYKINLENRYDYLHTIAEKTKPKYIIDFSSICMVNESWGNPSKYFRVNCLSKIKLILNLNKSKHVKKYVYISTPEVFGENRGILKENCNIYKPSTPYASTKLLTENLVRNYQAVKNKKFIIARFSNFYGPRQPAHRLIPKLIITIKKNEKFVIDGTGLSKRNYIFSKDFCNGIFLILKKGATRNTYHFSSKNLYTVLDIVKRVCVIMKVDYKKFVTFGKERTCKDSIYNLNCEMTKKNLSWRPNFSLDQGIKETITYIENNYKFIKKQNLNFKLNK